MSSPILVLGPQRPDPNLRAILDRQGIDGPLALITAGWRHDEAELTALSEHVGSELVHWPLYSWFHEALEAEPSLARAYRQRQREITAYNELYRLRLAPAVEAVVDLLAHVEDGSSWVLSELDAALDHLRDVDDRKLDAIAAIHRSHTEVCEPWNWPSVRARHEQIKEEAEGCAAVLIAGGHVAVLLNRMRFFGLDVVLETLREQGTPLVAWSAGAMVLCDEIALFYDDPPDGGGGVELLDRGLGLVKNAVFFPHARERLRMGDRLRIAQLARRLDPLEAITLERGAALAFHGAAREVMGSVRACEVLTAEGLVRPAGGDG